MNPVPCPILILILIWILNFVPYPVLILVLVWRMNFVLRLKFDLILRAILISCKREPSGGY